MSAQSAVSRNRRPARLLIAHDTVFGIVQALTEPDDKIARGLGRADDFLQEDRDRDDLSFASVTARAATL